MRVFPAVLALALAACVNLPGLSEGDAGASASGDAGATGDAAPAATGSGCTQDLGGGTILCTETSICPGLTVDHDKFPNCGFRIHGTAIDIECTCEQDLCPLGVPTTCAQAKTMLEDQTETQVCTQLNDGRCVHLGAGGADAGAPTQSSGCDKACAGECGGDPSCMQLCGC
jgi:hypothetical protein